jgi:predicted CXXCH cytochrome family protein
MAALVRRLVGCFLIAGWALSAQYVGSKACYGCHSAIYRSFTQTDMGRSMSLANEWKTDVLPAEATLGQPGTSLTFAISHIESGWVESESEPGVFSVDHPLAYSVGSGANGLTFLIRRGNYLFQAPLSYYSRTHKWDFSPGYEQADLGFSRVVPEECINCHSGRAAPVPNRPGAYAEAPFPELSIGCENCHGPGDAHVKSLGKKSGTIVNPAKLTPRLAENICMNCHQGGDTRVLQAGKSYLNFRPGQWLFDTTAVIKQPARTEQQQETDLLEHYSAMQASKCFRVSNGKLSCLTCHDPHVQPRKAEVSGYFRAKCLTCHTDQSCRLPLEVRAAQSPPNDCAACHMPKRSVQQISHSALTNHRIPARVDEPTSPIAQSETDGLVVVNSPPGRAAKLSKVMLLRAYGELGLQNADYQRRYADLLDELSKTQPQDTFVQGALGHKAFTEDRNEEAVAHLTLALPLDSAAVYLELGQALAKLGRRQESIGYLKKGVEMAPYNAVLQKTLILQYINLKSYSEATVLIKQYVATFPEDSFMRNILTRVSP